MKRKITEQNAVATVLDALFKQTDKTWEQLWGTIQQIVAESDGHLQDKSFSKFNYTLAAIAINMRSAYDIYPQPQADRLTDLNFRILEKFLGSGDKSVAVKNTLLRYMEAYNNGIFNIRNPVLDVSMLLYSKMAMENASGVITGAEIPPPPMKLIEFLTKSLMLFAGKWEQLNKQFELAK